MTMLRFGQRMTLCLAVPLSLALALATTLPPPAVAQEEVAAPMPRPVVTEIVSADPTRQRDFSGEIEAAHETELAFQTIGRMSELNVSPGDVVEKGAVLARLDRVSLQQDLDSAQAAVRSAQAQAEYARTSYSRARALSERDITTQEDVEAAKAGQDSANAQLLAAKASLAGAQEALSYATLIAPEAGVVLETPVEQGTVVSAGTTVVTLADQNDRDAVIDVPAEFIAVLPPDARFRLVGLENYEQAVEARLRLVEPVADDTTRGRTLRLTLDEAPSQFRLGSLVTATYIAGDKPLMTLPESALVDPDGAASVWRVTTEADGTRHVASVAVTLGYRIASRVIVTEGVGPGDEIVVRGAHSLEEGQAVGHRAVGESIE
ncbi:efflux RND transporter periplasmic adaptor subunit [Pseudooceanicola algae]|uniref:Multidrug resistance protein MdtA n=1 Tax=Pseudooceanicola algae TaxID=1537215 RepID=A0A418SJV5_9RHOB|nr:efflux RND transporter periplasmic adaptor subunit [Pseudooceanicola algae]QPM88800.1 Multidrug resistance protein MdtA [Pseudooceanicola algae]